MASTTLSTAPDNTTDTTFRAWGKGISDAIAALGWVKTADTGQINWATVLKPSAPNQSSGYEIWTPVDAQQATKPLYLKMEYGSGFSTAAAVGIYTTLGTSTDGAGNLGSMAGYGTTLKTRTPLFSSAYSNAVVGSSYVTGDSSEIVMALWPGLNNVTAGAWLHIGRSRDWAGAVTGDGAFLVKGAQGNKTSQAFHYKNLPQDLSDGTTGFAVVPSVSATWSSTMDGLDLYLLPMLCGPMYPQVPGPSPWAALIGAVDLPQGTVFSASHYGASRTWVAMNNGFIALSSTTWGPAGNAASLAPCLRMT